MLFNSYMFVAFIMAFFIVWATMPQHRLTILNCSSVIFYGAWNPAFVLLLIFSSVVDFILAGKIQSNHKSGKKYLMMSIAVNIGLLVVFKYLSFFGEAVSGFWSVFGFELPPFYLNVVLPVGISFYTFQTLSYSIDVYRGDLKAWKNFWEYFCFVSFFPQLVAGPIERGGHMLPQIQSVVRNQNVETWPKEGIALILRGFVKKLVIADNLAVFVNPVFADMNGYSWQSIVLATLYFSVQIYCDFSGYTDIARGIARLIGIRLMQNFSYPYLACSIQDFWRRWHISLSNWFRDYLYIPLGGNRHGTARAALYALTTMALCGLWHGAAYNFILWGVFHGALLVGQRFWSTLNQGRIRLGIGGWILTQTFVLAGWFIFRIEHIGDIEVFFQKFFIENSGAHRYPDAIDMTAFAIFALVTLIESKIIRSRVDEISSRLFVASMQIVAVFGVIYLFASPSDQAFIYFQF